MFKLLKNYSSEKISLKNEKKFLPSLLIYSQKNIRKTQPTSTITSFDNTSEDTKQSSTKIEVNNESETTKTSTEQTMLLLLLFKHRK